MAIFGRMVQALGSSRRWGWDAVGGEWDPIGGPQSERTHSDHRLQICVGGFLPSSRVSAPPSRRILDGCAYCAGFWHRMRMVALACAAVAVAAVAVCVLGQSYPHGANAADKSPTVPTELIQLKAMEALFDSTRGKSWVSNDNWESRDVTFFFDPCFHNFYGVTCENGNIIGINLSNNRWACLRGITLLYARMPAGHCDSQLFRSVSFYLLCTGTVTGWASVSMSTVTVWGPQWGWLARA